MDKKQFSKGFSLLTAAFPGHSVPNATADIYYSQLADMDGTLFEFSIVRCIRECKFFPTISEIRDRATDIAAEELGLTRAWARFFVEDGYTPELGKEEETKKLTGKK